MQPYPLKFLPILQPRVWGGRNLTRLGKKLPPRQRIGESWEICDRPEAQSIVANGPLAGKTLRKIWVLLQPPTPHRKSARFPLLIKWLDAAAPLSVQVHPAARAAHRIGGEPKSEAWFIVSTAVNARIWAGLKRGVTRAQLAQAAADSRVEKLLRSFKPRVGETILIPAGCVHAARGIVFCEVQQNSDTTYRLHDWGRDRPIQVEQALTCLKPMAAPRRGKSVRCPHFSVRPVAFRRLWTPPRGFAIVCIVNGAGEIQWRGGLEPFAAGDCWLIPSQLRDCRFKPVQTTNAILGKL